MTDDARNRWTNPLIGLAMRRAAERRGLAGYIVAAVGLPVTLGLACAYSPLAALLAPMRHSLGGGTPPAGDLFLLGLTLGAFLMLTIGGVLPRAALAVTREREQRALGALLVTRLSRPTIVVGKAAQAALLPLLGSLALLPPLCLALALGGVNGGAAAAAFGFLLLCHLLFASAGLCGSAWSRRSVVALVCAYGAAGLLCGGSLVPDLLAALSGNSRPGWPEILRALNPLPLLTEIAAPDGFALFGDPPPGALATASGVYLLLSLLFLALAARGLRTE